MRARVSAPDPDPKVAIAHRGEFSVPHLRRRLDRQTLHAVEMTVEDPPDGAVGPRDGANEFELVGRRRTTRPRPRIEGQRIRRLEPGDRRLRKGRDRLPISLRRGRGDPSEGLIDPKLAGHNRRCHRSASSVSP